MVLIFNNKNNPENYRNYINNHLRNTNSFIKRPVSRAKRLSHANYIFLKSLGYNVRSNLRHIS